MSTRELPQIICQTEGRDWQDMRLLSDVTKRASKALWGMRAQRAIASEQNRRGTLCGSLREPEGRIDLRTLFGRVVKSCVNEYETNHRGDFFNLAV